MANSHLKVIQAGIRYNRDLKALSNSTVGNKTHPRGTILRAFNRAKTALAGSFGNPLATAIILEEYRATVLTAVREASGTALEIGETQATAMLTEWGLPTIEESQAALIDQGVNAADMILSGQIRAIESGTLTEAQILGGARRVGLFAAGAVMGAVNNWLITSAAGRVAGMMKNGLEKGKVPASQFVMQAIAAIDENTTPCCLAVHGQIKELKDDFFTPEPPAFSEFQRRPPFHRFCRTSQTLVRRADSLDALTSDMELAAALELQLRKKPNYIAPHPANAFSRVRTGGGVRLESAPKLEFVVSTKGGGFTDVTVGKEEVLRKWGIKTPDTLEDLPEYWGSTGNQLLTEPQKLAILNDIDIELTRMKKLYPNFEPDIDNFILMGSDRGRAFMDRQHQVLTETMMQTKFEEWPDYVFDHERDWKAHGRTAPYGSERKGRQIADNFRHEVGHVLSTSEFEGYWVNNVQWSDDIEGGYSLNWFDRNVTQYSSENRAESIADTFGIFTREDYVMGTFPDALEKAMLKLLGEE